MILKMKLLLIFLLCTFSVFSQKKDRKKALLIGIGEYENDWTKLAGDADMELMKETLLYQDFHLENIKSLKNQEAKKKPIETAFEKLILDTKKNDIVVIFFSGHGKQIPDQKNGDEKEDGLDEALVPYDSESQKDNKTLVIDDQIGEWIEKLKTNVGSKGHILLILNSCHSGTGAKGDKIENKTYQTMKYDFMDKVSPTQNIGKFVAFEASTSGRRTFQIETPDKKSYGALTYATAMAFENIKQNTSYATFFQQIENIMYGKGGNPFCEDDLGSSHEKVLDGEVKEQTLSYQIKKVFNNRYKILGGYLENINIGAGFNFGKNKTKGDFIPVAKGVVVESNAFDSIIEIKEGNIPDEYAGIIGIQTEQNFGNFKVAVQFKSFKNKALQKSLEEVIAHKSTIVTTTETPDLEILDEKDSLNINSFPEAFFHWKIKKEGAFQQETINKIIDFGRAKIIAELKVDNPYYKAAISYKHAINKKVNDKWVSTIYGDTTQHSIVFDTSQQGLFTIKNTGNETFYFTLLDIQPDGIINVTLPNEKQMWVEDDLKLMSGEEKSFPIGKPSKPYGLEMYKVILSPNYDDFSFLTWQDKEAIESNTKGDDNPIIALFKDLSQGTMQRTKGNLPFVGGTTELIFKIIPAH